MVFMQLAAWRWWRRARAVAPLALFVLASLASAAVAQAQAPRTITLEFPTNGGVVVSPVNVRGRVTIAPFENTLRGRVYDASGRVVGQGPINVTPTTPGNLGGPGTFSGQIPFTIGATGPGRVEIADISAADGSVLASASANVTLGAPGARLPRTGSAEVSAGSLPAGWAGARLALLAGLAGFAATRFARARGRDKTPRTG
jgi:hypothetical protein